MNKKIIIPILVILVMGVIALIYLNFHQHHEMTELVEQMEFEKEQLQEEYEDLAIQFDGYQNLDIRNDSLQELLSQEQQRVQDLLEELRITKVTNARRISELKKELATVRAIMVDYVRQIDSLNVTNQRLTEENIQVKTQYQQVSRQAAQLEQEKTQLTAVVNRASMLEITDFSFITLNQRDKKTRLVGQIRKLQFNFTIGKNITCEPGNKVLYLRLLGPDGEVMILRESNVFTYENQEIAYSVKMDFEYTGEAYSGTLYWTLDGEPQQGIYNADFFIDGNLIGSFPCEIKR